MKKIIGKTGNGMKKIVALFLCIVFFSNALAQKSKFVGTWTGVLRSFYTDYKDKTIVVRITQENGDYQVRIKECNPQDSNDCSYGKGVYGIEINGNALQWYWKANREIGEDEEDYKTYGAVYSEGKCFGRVKYSGGALYNTKNYWNYWKLYDRKGRVVQVVDEENQYKQFIEEAVLYKDNDKW